jgi:histidinol phosphatase-like enzyme
MYEVKPVLFIDIDSTVRQTASGKAFPENKYDYKLYPGIEDKIWKYKDANYEVVGLCNSQFKLENMFIRNPFYSIYYCFYPQDIKSIIRKPGIGMIALAERDLFYNFVIIDYKNSIVIGDRVVDSELAQALKIRFIWSEIFRNGDTFLF